ncbi:hypothetical protein CVM52_11265 [Pseudooceanicola lipolyticus]|uniref:DUF4276 domain-containing protein n=1 Tax=Pseudooceanicola lipolyticus TaxID=2029104 RepID=A0A2M8J1A6_9RHOB|nr:DUF4276 family protein [Pseudooceanicola lipolyticus]PJE36569.1 hypothetical protein CVM52_11265 [Pseudooceanicola lipolyticus]
MTYISWGLYVEGRTDADYFNVLIPRMITHLLRGSDGPISLVPDLPAHTFGIPRLNLDAITEKVCEGSEAFHLFFVHGDTGGRAVAEQLEHRTCALCERIQASCDFRRDRCIVIAPNRETEAWTLADISAVRRVFGFTADAHLNNIPTTPTQVEHIQDPKRVTQEFLEVVSGTARRKRLRWPFENIAQEQNIDLLLQVPSFRTFSEALKVALRGVGHPNI